MALRRRGFVSVGAVVACCALAAACSPDQAPVSTPSPPPAATPAESQIERQIRLDYEAAEKAYRANRAEQDRLYQAGGATKATSALKATATGSYLRITVEVAARISRRRAGMRLELQKLWASSRMVAGRRTSRADQL